jgi:hypothetical protein
MMGDTGRNSTSRDASSQPNQWEIKSKDVKLPPQTKAKDFIREQFCCRPPREHRPDRAKKLVKSFNDGLKEIHEKLKTIPEELLPSFKMKIDPLITAFQNSYDQTLRNYGSQSGAGSRFIRDLGERSMERYLRDIQEMQKKKRRTGSVADISKSKKRT